MSTPITTPISVPVVITIFVRHSAGCKYEGEEFSKRCRCRKHLRWSKDGKQHRRGANTRSWEEAERVKRDLEDLIAGRKPTLQPSDKSKSIENATSLFIKDKKVQGVSDNTLQKYTLLLKRLCVYGEKHQVHTVQGINRELLTGFCSTWEEMYTSAITRSKTREKLRSFLRYCYEAQWLPRVLEVPKIQISEEDEPETQPLTPEEYKLLLKSIPGAISKGDPRRKTESNTGRRGFDDEDNLCFVVHTFIECMCWSGLAIRDALTLPRTSLEQDSKKVYRIITKRKKTGNAVSVPIPRPVADAMLKAHALNSNPKYFFWTGNGKPQSATSNWGQRYISPVFKAAGIESDGNMVSHRLRDTFAVHLLEKGTPMEELSRLLGHKSIRITEKHYAKWSKLRQDRADGFVLNSW